MDSSNTLTQLRIVWIADDAALAECCLRWRQVPLLALDTEFVRTDTFYPIAGLLQISDGEACYLIDPLAIRDFAPLSALMTDPAVVKILHSGSEDIEVFDRVLGVLPTPLLDTQVGAALAGLGFSMSYQRLAEALLGIHVEKGETRSDWLRRPLSESQCHYAALDVAPLPAMYASLEERLRSAGKWSWWLEDSAQHLRASALRLPDDQYYRKLKAAHQLKPAQLALLQQLVSWREALARKSDVPRGRILKDHLCIEIARRQPANKPELANIRDMESGTIRRHGETILDIVEKAQQLTPDSYPPALPPPLPPEHMSVMKRLKAVVEGCAERHQVARELLARNADLEDLLESALAGTPQLPASLRGWREAIVGAPLLAALAAPEKTP